MVNAHIIPHIKLCTGNFTNIYTDQGGGHGYLHFLGTQRESQRSYRLPKCTQKDNWVPNLPAPKWYGLFYIY